MCLSYETPSTFTAWKRDYFITVDERAFYNTEHVKTFDVNIVSWHIIIPVMVYMCAEQKILKAPVRVAYVAVHRKET